ncbi:MAG: Trk family potassium uptake protein [Bacilli bacterium]|nr:Trk family potassium uptake protein [Bacilli bacterium]
MNKFKRLQPITLLFAGFLVLILAGAFLLWMPFASKDGHFSNFVDALFVSTSAACVTGLSPFNTFDHWNLFGQIVILVLIQIGGLGFMTFISVVLWIVNKDLGLYGKTVIMQSAGTFSFGSVKPLLRRILIGTFIFELIGAILLSVFFFPEFGFKGIWYGTFTSISAFCNAGFDLFSGSFSSSLSAFRNNPGVLVTIGCLILIGGSGFVVWSDLIDSKFRWGRLQMHTKIVLTSTLVLTIVPMFLFMLFDFTDFGRAGAYTTIDIGAKFLNSFFLAVTPRTAGFASVDYSLLSPASKTLTILLMFIGGNSGSTAGGLKVTTMVVIIFNLVANARGKDEVAIFKQRINGSIIRQSSALMLSYLAILFVAIMVITSVDDIGTEAAIFECVSGLATVGLSLGVTGTLSITSKIVLILLMYIGRLGAFGLFNLIMGKSSEHQLLHPEGRIMVG